MTRKGTVSDPLPGCDTQMMTTAIALFGTRISPRFDCAQDFMLITSSNSRVTDQRTETIKERMPILKVKRLADLKVDTLICGGVDETSREYLRAYGIKVVANMKGNVDDAVSHYLPSLGSAPTPPEEPCLIVP